MNEEKVYIRNGMDFRVLLVVLIFLLCGGGYLYYNGATKTDIINHIDRGREQAVIAGESIRRARGRLDEVERGLVVIEERVINSEDTVQRCQERNSYCRELTISSKQGVISCKEILGQLREEK